MKPTKILAAFAVIMMMTVVAAPAVTAEDSVDLTATVLEPKPEIGIELNATALSFGSLYPGNTSDPQDLKVTNIGLKTVDVTAEASDDQGQEALFVPGLLIDSASWTEYESTLAEDESDDTQLALHVPDEYASRGDVSGGAIFWAEEHMGSSPVEHFTYTSSGSKVTITGYVGPGGDVIIPSEIEGLPVTDIGSRSVGMFDSPLTAFSYCTTLTSVTIPDSVTSIGHSAFFGCTALTSVTIGSGVTHIREAAFQYCTALTSVTIPDSVTRIEAHAFQECDALTSVTIGSGVTSIGDDAFNDCSALTSVTIGSGVTSIAMYAFGNCYALSAINVDPGNSAYASVDGALYNKAVTTLMLCPAVKASITIPDSVTSIRVNAFRHCTALTSVTIPDSVTSIEDSAFRDCTALTSMTFEGNAPNMGTDWAYQVPTTMIVYYHPGATGFTDPWEGFATVVLTP